MEHDTIRGRLVYSSRKPERYGEVRGGETFVVTRQVDGGRTLRAHCAIDDGSPRVLRDVTASFDRNNMPTDAFIRLTVDEAFVGCTWYRFTPTLAESKGFTVEQGRISTRFALDTPVRLFATHPLMADAFHTSHYDLSKGPGMQKVGPLMMCSVHHRGADGPILVKRPSYVTMVFVGEEMITVAAGEFKALHFRLGQNEDDDYMGADIHPPYHVWVTADGNYILLKAHVTGYMQTYYELTELQIGKGYF